MRWAVIPSIPLAPPISSKWSNQTAWFRSLPISTHSLTHSLTLISSPSLLIVKKARTRKRERERERERKEETVQERTRLLENIYEYLFMQNLYKPLTPESNHLAHVYIPPSTTLILPSIHPVRSLNRSQVYIPYLSSPSIFMSNLNSNSSNDLLQVRHWCEVQVWVIMITLDHRDFVASRHHY
jgi:hypothetical protein